MERFTIYSKEDIAAFFIFLTNELEVNFHPDDSFFDYVNIHTGEPTFTGEDAAKYDNIMQDCFDWCEANDEDIYLIALELFNATNGSCADED
ncbi:hypothetical protein EFA69_02640 [Rufibacter immobilis]|uniref:Uncharacterized protein n=1 Tax=Rufibacter immobilis TaxID=1348778 RepID=A0A3M9N4W3_9BACT|nr:hypothetical protein [Rufibacter immobilis]RNI32243.1 hypothetical protein EFA69_02640 [Rufibacter immobilis]